MQEKSDTLSGQPHEVLLEITSYLSYQDLQNLGATTRSMALFTKPLIHDRILPILLQDTVHANHGAMKQILKKWPWLMLQRGSVVDYSGRVFQEISPFEYMLWAGDRWGLKDMFDCISPTNTSNYIPYLLEQYHKVKKDGITYTLNREIVTETSFDLSKTLIPAYQTFSKLRDANPRDQQAFQESWINGVGAIQRLLPVHFVYEYCSAISWETNYDFSKRPKQSMKFYNRNIDPSRYEDWFAPDSKIGKEFAIFKLSRPDPKSCGASSNEGDKCFNGGNWLALRNLDTKIKQETKEFGMRLEEMQNLSESQSPYFPEGPNRHF